MYRPKIPQAATIKVASGLVQAAIFVILAWIYSFKFIDLWSTYPTLNFPKGVTVLIGGGYLAWDRSIKALTVVGNNVSLTVSK